MKTYTINICLTDMSLNSRPLENSYAHTERRMMAAANDREAEKPVPRCAQCGVAGEFGYRNVHGAMRWFCARHPLAQFWADARLAISTNNGRVLTDDNDHQQVDPVAAEPAAESFSCLTDSVSWDRPRPDVDRFGLVCRRAGMYRQLTAVVHDRTPHFDAAGRFIHPCSNCGCEAILGTGVNVRAGQLRTWYCSMCKSPPSR